MEQRDGLSPYLFSVYMYINDLEETLIFYGHEISVDMQMLYFNLLLYADDILSLRLRDNSVHLHECSPFWVSFFIIVLKMFDVDMRTLINKSLKHVYMLSESLT